MADVGFVGLGAMGGGMAKRLLGAGHRVYGYNRTRARAEWLLEHGIELMGTPREAADPADVVFSMVRDAPALETVFGGPEGILAGLGAGKVYVDMTTATPSTSRALAERAAATGAHMLDAPVSGSTVTLEEGRLSIMVGGDEEAYRRVEPILRDIGPTVKRVGSIGQALLLKIAINLSLQVQMAAFCEGLLLAEKDGIDKEVAVETMLSSVIASPMLKYRGPFVLELPEEPLFDVNMMQKDMDLALEAGRRLDVSMPTTAIANELLTAARGMGLEHEDFAVVYEVLADLAGVRKVVS